MEGKPDPSYCIMTINGSSTASLPGIHGIQPCIYMLSAPVSLLWLMILCLQEAQLVKNPLMMQETQIQSLVQEDPVEKEIASYSSVLAWENPMERGA